MDTKIKVVRESGLPVSIENYKQFNIKWKVTYDKTIDKYLEKGEDKDKGMLRIQKILERYERLLKRAYPMEERWDMLVGDDKTKAILKEYGPIIIAIERETQELVYVIADSFMG
jgi:hypothetical protein